jgi:hypothetical protein
VWGAAILLQRHPLHALIAYSTGWQELAARITAPAP